MSRSRPTTPDAAVQVTVRGDVPDDAVRYAEAKVAHLDRYAAQPVLASHVVLTVSADPAVAWPARAEATVDVGGTLVRAHAGAADVTRAVDALEDRLRRTLLQHQERERTRHRWTGVATEGEWRHGDLPTERGPFFPRPPETREVVRRKTFALAPMTLDEAAFEMDLLGHDFYLFTDAATGKDAVVCRDGDGGFAAGGETTAGEGTVEVRETPAQLTEAEARARLELSGEPFVFYLDPDTGRGQVLYLRYDGHYGLITAAGE